MYKTVLFDLDGTITDPKTGITRSVQYALKRFDIIIDDIDKLEKFIGPPLKQSFTDFYSFTEEQASEAVNYYREYFSSKGIFENHVYEGIPELLAELLENNLTLAVATSKPTVYAEKIIRHFGLDRYFKKIIGSKLDNTMTDKKEIIAYAMSELNSNASDTIMTGDRKHDIIGAKKNRIDSAGVLYGYGSYEEITGAGPDFIAEEVQDLSSILLN